MYEYNYALIRDGIVENIVIWNGEGNIFSDYITISVEGLECGIGWVFDGSTFKQPPPPTPAISELIAQANYQKNTLLEESYNSILLEKTKLLMGRKLTEKEMTRLSEWVDYIEILKSIETGDPESIAWPPKPEN